MAVLNTAEFTNKPSAEVFGRGKQTIKVVGKYAKTASVPADADILVLAQGLPANTAILSVRVDSSATAGFTDADIVLIDQEGALVKDASDANCLLADGLSFASAKVFVDVLGSGVSGYDRSEPIYKLTGKSPKQAGSTFGIGLLVNTAGSATGTVSVEIELTNPVSA